ncbi:MAG: PmeII family type II restriction endonuclease [Chloroflexi bacterium]|nr:PmeII family type II restriction endonuclease [Chloroflexota bacterium]
MGKLLPRDLERCIGEQMVIYYERLTATLKEVTFEQLFEVNPYSFRLEQSGNVGQIAMDSLNESLRPVRDQLLEDALREIAIFVAGQVFGGCRSSLPGMDVEFVNRGTYYAVAIELGPERAGNSRPRMSAQEICDAVVRSTNTLLPVQPALGVCWGKAPASYLPDGTLSVEGQQFWYLVSDDPYLHIDLVKPLRRQVLRNNEGFRLARDGTATRLFMKFYELFCGRRGVVKWGRLAQYTSGNYTPGEFPPQRQ